MEGTGTFILACESLNAECYGAVSVYTQRTYMYTSSVFRDELSDWLPPCVTASTDHMYIKEAIQRFAPEPIVLRATDDLGILGTCHAKHEQMYPCGIDVHVYYCVRCTHICLYSIVTCTCTWCNEKKLAAYSMRPTGIWDTGIRESLPSGLILPRALARMFDLPARFSVSMQASECETNSGGTVTSGGARNCSSWPTAAACSLSERVPSRVFI